MYVFCLIFAADIQDVAMKKISLSQRFFLNSFFALALVIILITTYFSYHQIKKIIASHEWVKHTYTVMENSQTVLLKIQEVEAEVRGYWILGDKAWLKDIDEDVEDIIASVALLKNNTTDNEQQQALVKKIRANCG